MRFYRFLKRRPFLRTKRMTRMNGCLIPCNKPGRRRLFHRSCSPRQPFFDPFPLILSQGIASGHQSTPPFRSTYYQLHPPSLGNPLIDDTP